MAHNALDTSSDLEQYVSRTEMPASFSGAHHGFYRGIVIVRNDPDKQGRIKVSCPQVFGAIPTDELPWCYPVTSSWNTSNTGQQGAANGSQSGQTGAGGHVNVPPLGAPVMIAFEGGDHRYPIYFGGSPGKPGFNSDVPDYSFTKNPGNPDNYSFATPDGTMVQMDNRAGKQQILAMTPNGNYVSINQAGLIEVKSKDTVSIKGANLLDLQCDSAIQAKGNKVIVYSTGDLVVEGASSVSINSDSVVNVQASTIKLNCGSSMTAQSQYKQIDTSATTDGS